jgi:hypothetical protein
MRRKPVPASERDAHAARVAWWAAFLATLAMVAVLGMAQSAQALGVPAAGEGAATLLLPADEELELEGEASEGEEFEVEECEVGADGECVVEPEPETPPECLLSSASATVSAAANQDRVRLQVRYTTTAPTAVVVDYGLHGSKGSLFLGSEKKRFGREGVLRLTKSLTEAQMAKVMAAKAFTVRLRVAAAPRYCQSLFEHQLNVRRATPAGLAWQQSE